MKKMILILAAAIAIYYARIYAAAKNALKITVSSIKNVSFKGGTLRLILNLNVQNLSSTAIPVTYANLVNTFGTSEIGTSVLSQRVTLRNGSNIVPIVIEVPLFGLISLGAETVNLLKTGSLKMRLSGTLSAAGIAIPVNEEINEKLPFTINI